MIKLEFDAKTLGQRLEGMRARQIPFALALTLTRTAQAMQVAEAIELKYAFDRPTPFTQRSVFIRGATKKKLEAYVFLRDEASRGTPPVKYLAPGVYGGPRRVKRFERALVSAGILFSNELAVPGAYAPIDAYGNIRGSEITRILSAVRGSSDATQNRRRGKRGSYFAGAVRAQGAAFGDAGTRGIWKREGRDILPVMIFVDRGGVDYRKRYDFFGVIEQVIDRGELRKQWKLAWQHALRTAR